MEWSSEIEKNLQIWKEGGEPQLLKAEVLPTSRCNLRCRFCWNKETHQRPDMISDDQLRTIVHECLGEGVREFSFSGGGEPWLRRTVLLELMRDISGAGCRGLLTTNGTLLSDDDIREIVRMGWGYVLFSMDGPSPEVHDSLRGKPGAFGQTIRALRSFRREKEQSGVRLPQVAINCVINRENAHLLPEMIRLAAEEHCDTIYFQALMPYAPSAVQLVLDENEEAAFLSRIGGCVELARTLRIDTNVGDFSTPNLLQDSMEVHKTLTEQIKGAGEGLAAIPCFEPWKALTVVHGGWMSVCPELAERGPLRQKVSNTSCREAWLGKETEQIRRMMFSGTHQGVCRTCCTNKLFENHDVRQWLQGGSG